jgi:hypothetical protein
MRTSSVSSSTARPVKTRIDRRATNISVLAAIGVRRDGQKVLLSIMSEAGQRLIRGINRPLNGR